MESNEQTQLIRQNGDRPIDSRLTALCGARVGGVGGWSKEERELMDMDFSVMNVGGGCEWRWKRVWGDNC